MTTDQTILYLTVGLTVFFLATVLLYIAYSRNKINFRISKARLLKAYQEQREKNKYLALDYAQSEANGKSLNALLEQAGEQRKQLRKDFIEQSEIATQWRQKHDKLKESFDKQIDYMKRTAASWNKLSNEVAQLEAELDRGNEMISWLKGDLEMAFNLLREAFKLLKEDCDAAQEVKIQELDHLFKNPFREKKPKGWNLKVYPRDEKGRVRKASDFIHKEFEPKDGVIEVVTGAGKGPAETNHDNAVLEHIQEIITEQEGGIDWSKPQPFPKDYRIPKGTECVNLTEGVYGSFIVPELTKVATIESSFNPFVKRLDGKHRQNKVSVNYNDFADKCFNGIDLAPINPTDHPLHPEFKGKNP